jgi:hypothetical protein
VAGSLVAREGYDPSLYDRVDGRLGLAAFVGVPILLFLGVLATLVLAPEVNESFVLVGFASAVAAIIGGGTALVANAQVWTRHVRETSTLVETWTARRPKKQRHRTRTIGAAFAVAAIIGVVAAFALDVSFASTVWIAAFGPMVGILAAADREREVEARDVGLLVDSTLAAWSDLEWFAVTDDAVVVRQDAWLGERTYRFEREDLDCLDAVVTVMERFGVPRQDAAT